MWQQLRDVAHVSTGYPFRGKVSPEDDGDVTVVQMKDIDAASGLKVDEALRLRGQGGKYDRYLLAPGDVLFQSRGSRHPVAVVDAPIRGIAALGLHVIRPHARDVRPEYLAWILNHPRTQEQLRDTARGSYVPFVSKGDLEDFRVPIPPLEIQDRIVAVARLRQQEEALAQQLNELTQHYLNVVTWQAATSGEVKGS